MSSRGESGYEEYCRILVEFGRPQQPEWESLNHIQRMAWQAASQTISQDVTQEEASLNAERMKNRKSKTVVENIGEGDCVSLLSGGVPMTVEKSIKDSAEVECVWFDSNQELLRGVFAKITLKRIILRGV